MRQRCFNPNNGKYPKYGARGIRVCDAWNASYERWIADMGRRPSREHSIDRIDNDGPYACGQCADCLSRGITKTNCRWATRKEQQRNMSTNRRLTFGGVTQPVAAWAEQRQIKPQVLLQRIATFGWSVERALTEPVVAGKGRYQSARKARGEGRG